MFVVGRSDFFVVDFGFLEVAVLVVVIFRVVVVVISVIFPLVILVISVPLSGARVTDNELLLSISKLLSLVVRSRTTVVGSSFVSSEPTVIISVVVSVVVSVPVIGLFVGAFFQI